jgi:hypothetical protein
MSSSRNVYFSKYPPPDEKLADKIDVYNKKKMTDTIEDTLKWLEINQDREILFLSFSILFGIFLAC